MMERPLAPSADAEVRALLQQRRKIDAIKRIRENTGLGLKEAKDKADAIEREMGLPPASVPGATLFAVALALIAAMLGWWWLNG
jgi:ribosomal L7/L12-like protein